MGPLIMAESVPVPRYGILRLLLLSRLRTLDVPALAICFHHHHLS